MTRIKYYQISRILYTDWFTIGPNLVIRGWINLDSLESGISEFNGDSIYSNNLNSLRKSKHDLKNNLSKLGVVFTDEIRSRK